MFDNTSVQYLLDHSTAFFYGGYLLLFLLLAAGEALAPVIHLALLRQIRNRSWQRAFRMELCESTLVVTLPPGRSLNSRASRTRALPSLTRAAVSVTKT